MLQESDVEFESNLQRLQEIFRQQPASHLRSLLLAHGMHKAIDILIGEVVDELRSGECSSKLRDSQVSIFIIVIIMFTCLSESSYVADVTGSCFHAPVSWFQ